MEKFDEIKVKILGIFQTGSVMYLTANLLNMGLINQHIKRIFSFSLYFSEFTCIFLLDEIQIRCRLRLFCWTLHPASPVLQVWWNKGSSIQWMPKIAPKSYSKPVNFLCECIQSVLRAFVWINLIYFQGCVDINYREVLVCKPAEANCLLLWMPVHK